MSQARPKPRVSPFPHVGAEPPEVPPGARESVAITNAAVPPAPDSFGSLADIGEPGHGRPPPLANDPPARPSALPPRMANDAMPPSAPRASQPPPSRETSHTRLKAIVEETVVTTRRDYRRE